MGVVTIDSNSNIYINIYIYIYIIKKCYIYSIFITNKLLLVLI